MDPTGLPALQDAIKHMHGCESSWVESVPVVETFKGIMQLSGFVTSKNEADRAVVVAQNVRGVTSVKNDMRLK